MCYMNRFRLAVLLLILGALFATSPALAVKPGHSGGDSWGKVQLLNTGDESLATGTASLTGVKLVGVWNDWTWSLYTYSGKLTVNCRNLTPGSTYWTPAGTFTADATGAGKTTGSVEFWLVAGDWNPLGPFVVDVVRLDSDGSSTTVLTGELWP